MEKINYGKKCYYELPETLKTYNGGHPVV